MAPSRSPNPAYDTGKRLSDVKRQANDYIQPHKNSAVNSVTADTSSSDECIHLNTAQQKIKFTTVTGCRVRCMLSS
jgi:hypothetical protein